MAEQNNVLQLKRLAVKLTGKKIENIKGSTISDVLDFIQSNYTGGGGGGGATIMDVTLNANSDYGVHNGVVTMSDGTTIAVNVALIDELTLTSTEGSAKAKTVVAVEPTLTAGNHYRISAGSDTLIPASGEDLSEWTEWNSTSEIDAQNGVKLRVAECDTDNKAVKCGIVAVKAPIF